MDHDEEQSDDEFTQKFLKAFEALTPEEKVRHLLASIKAGVTVAVDRWLVLTIGVPFLALFIWSLGWPAIAHATIQGITGLPWFHWVATGIIFVTGGVTFLVNGTMFWAVAARTLIAWCGLVAVVGFLLPLIGGWQ